MGDCRIENKISRDIYHPIGLCIYISLITLSLECYKKNISHPNIKVLSPSDVIISLPNSVTSGIIKKNPLIKTLPIPALMRHIFSQSNK